VISYRLIADMLRGAVPALRHAGTARNFGSIQAGAIAWPSAWVIPLSQRAGANRYAECNLVDQNVIERFGVILAIRDIAMTSGSTALSEAETIQPATVEALARYQPPGAESTCIQRQGRLVSGVSTDGQMFWQDDFEVQFSRRITGE
jgi:hypothetical protein